MVTANTEDTCLTTCWALKKEKRKKFKEQRAKQTIKMVNKAIMHRHLTKFQTFKKSIPSDQPRPTLSIAFSCSIFRRIPSDKQAVQLLGNIARISSIFKVNEIVVFDDKMDSETDEVDMELMERSIRILEYCECPQYLRKLLFGHHQDLQYVGVLNPLTTPHHFKKDDEWSYREGVVCNKRDKTSKCSMVTIGIDQDVVCDRKLKPGVRVTVKRDGLSTTHCFIVSPNAPFDEDNIYWGYRVRYASSPEDILSKSVYNCPYDLTIGTSEKGIEVDRVECFKPYKHALVLFGGLYGLEEYFKPSENAYTSAEHFDFYLNTCPSQGTRTIRTEEAMSITLSALRPLLPR